MTHLWWGVVRCVLTLALILVPVLAHAAVVTNAGPAGSVRSADELPATCTQSQIFFDTAEPSGQRLFVCDSTNTWILVITAEADTPTSVYTRNKVNTTATSFANAARDEDGSGTGQARYTDPILGPVDVCYTPSGENECDYKRQLNAGYAWGVRDNNGDDIFTVSNDTGEATNLHVNAEGTNNVITLQDEKWFPVATCQNTTATANFDLPASNAPAPTCDTGSNTQKGYLAFDAGTDESFEDSWILPTGFTGAIDVHFRWKAAATSGAAGWCAQLIRVPDGSTSDPAYPAQASGNCVSDTAKGTTLQENSATISGVTCSSCAAGDHVYVRISRDANGGAVTDDMTGDALLLMYGRTIRVAH